MAASDEHAEGTSKSAEQYYSERLAKLIKEGEMKFDSKYLE